MTKKYLFSFLLIIISAFSYSQTQNDKIRLQNISLITNTPLIDSKIRDFKVLSNGKITTQNSYDEVHFIRDNVKSFHVYDDHKKLTKSFTNGINIIQYSYENDNLISSIYYTDMYYDTSSLEFLNKTDEILKSHHYILNKTTYSYKSGHISNKTAINKSGEKTVTQYDYDSKGRISKINNFTIEYDYNDNIILIHGINKEFVLENNKILYSEATKFIHENSLLKYTQKVFKTNFIIQVTDNNKGIVKKIPMTPLIAKSIPILKSQGVKVQLLKNNNPEWEVEQNVKHEYEFNEFGDWIEKKSYKENFKNNEFKPFEGEYRSFIKV